MKLSFEKSMKYLDYIAIFVGLLAIVLSVFGVDCEILIVLAGLGGIAYIIYAFCLYMCRPKFDWHLIHGHFLRKVVAIVSLFPSIMTSGFLLYNTFCAMCKEGNVEYSPKNLAFDDNLYSDNNAENDTICVAKYDYFTEPVFLNAHNLELSGDSIIL